MPKRKKSPVRDFSGAKRKAAEGVAVYVIFDSFGNLVVPRTFKSSFHPAIHVLEYCAIRRPWQLLDPRRYALDHRKLLIVDGITSFISYSRYVHCGNR